MNEGQQIIFDKVEQNILQQKNGYDLSFLEGINDTLVLKPLFSILEKYPNYDFESPGELVHYLETYYKNGYEEQLVESLNRKPTNLTIWMLNRIMNDNSNVQKTEHLNLLKSISKNTKLSDQVREEALNFLTFQQKTNNEN